MVSLADDNLMGEITRFIEQTEKAIHDFLSKEIEKWMHRSLCYHVPAVFDGTLPLGKDATQFIRKRCNVVLCEHEGWQRHTLFVDDKPVAEFKFQTHPPKMTVKYNCKGRVT